MNHEIKFIKTRIIIPNRKPIGVFGRNSFRNDIGADSNIYFIRNFNIMDNNIAEFQYQITFALIMVSDDIKIH